jgi:hypothetical protein
MGQQPRMEAANSGTELLVRQENGAMEASVCQWWQAMLEHVSQEARKVFLVRHNRLLLPQRLEGERLYRSDGCQWEAHLCEATTTRRR